jgi:iron-hydrogenase subunit gamma
MEEKMEKDLIDSKLEKYPYAERNNLISILQDIQEDAGYLSREALVKVGKHLGLSSSKIYGVATFYNQFRFIPKGKYHFTICRGTACHVKGSGTVLKMLTAELGLKPGETSRDQIFSLEVVACMGACGLAPVVDLNGELHAKVTPKKLTDIVKHCKEEELKNAENK